MVMDLNILKKAKVVGMTTSGAARLRKLLQTLAPNIGIRRFIIGVTHKD